jgi:hypothetical protein
MRRGLFLLVCIMVLSGQSIAECHPVLWPGEKILISQTSKTPQQELENLQIWAEKSLREPPHPLAILASAGKIKADDANLLSSRTAFQDADRAAVLALAFTLNHKSDYLNKSREILLAWSNTSHPTGNPIDETRLEGMVWAYDLISCDLSSSDKSQISQWLENIRNKKIAWQFGPFTSSNNHRIHQLKMLLLLDKVLGHTTAWQADLETAKKYSEININPNTGESIDYRERNALHYHNYDLQAWLEITLISHCCMGPVIQSFNFLSDRILSHNIGGEFEHSTAKIDQLRDEGGFLYAKKGSTFDVHEAASTSIVYYTLLSQTPQPELWTIVQTTKPSYWLTFLMARRTLW